jgi:RNA polymerase sigma-70 factor (ECF subfamily)
MKTWDALMRASLAGDEGAYTELLGHIASAIRRVVKRSRALAGAGAVDVEDIVQETLLSVHLKRHTWDPAKPVAPWVMAIARNKLVDALRRRERRAYVPLEFFAETLEAPVSSRELDAHDAGKILSKLKPRELLVVRAIVLEENSVSEAAKRLELSEGAVRVLLHRTLKKLSAIYRSG